MNWFRLKACVKCGGDLVLDEGDWLCLQCGTYYYIGLYRDWQSMELVERPPLHSNHHQAKTIGRGVRSYAPTDLTGPPVYQRLTPLVSGGKASLAPTGQAQQAEAGSNSGDIALW